MNPRRPDPQSGALPTELHPASIIGSASAAFRGFPERNLRSIAKPEAIAKPFVPPAKTLSLSFLTRLKAAPSNPVFRIKREGAYTRIGVPCQCRKVESIAFGAIFYRLKNTRRSTPEIPAIFLFVAITPIIIDNRSSLLIN